MKKIFLRLATYVLILAVFVGGVGLLGYNRSFQDFYGALRQEPVPALQGVKKPEYDPNKPTVAVLLGNETTEGSDFMIPYELFSRTEAFNVFAVASDNQVKSLTGGLDLVPHYSFTELVQLLGKSPDIITIPFMVTNDAEKFAPIRKWIQQHANTTFVSICGGSGNLAATGLLKGKSAATHWQNLVVFPKQFPETNWLADQRYFHNGNVISSAGVSSGIDAVLYVISQKVGEPVAEKIAKEMKYPSYHFVKNPKVDPFYMDFRFSTYVLNNAFQWNKKQAGVLLYNGVEEMALASVFDIYSDTGTTRVLSISSSEQPIVTKHGLNLISRHVIANAPQLDKLMIPGRDAKSLAAAEIRQWNEARNDTNPQFVHSDSPDRFLFEVQLEDLAKQEDLLTAKHALKRLEFRSNDIQLEGKPFPLETYSNLLLTAFLALFIAFCIDRRLIIKKPFFQMNTLHRYCMRCTILRRKTT
ncbi:DJ-1/PfpI family protein [Brevibacillus panacihumi W25]|uniref:DJ-1/PfpI family protein n=1 Tax=Brevibacillus panacihumi W25 TaxID=1408254 RepID=V6M8N4_9BACL|nr:DJ-1/PfpI family protein [Brevibacillus panacihumi]EST54899.1 DJ-1/PfpI family protein [Brevibacillus panacihumi W25]